MAITEKQQRFIEDIAKHVQKYAKAYGILVHSPIIAQAILESGWGESKLASKYHNYFGMKCGTTWKGKSVNMETKEEYTPGTLTTIKDNFRVYDSMEEGACRTMQDAIRRTGMMEVNKKFLLIDNENMDELSIRLRRQKSPDIVVIDSFQYTRMTYRQYIDFKEQHKRKLLIFISHAEGQLPNGRAAKGVMYDASLKIYVEGFRAFSKGRFIGPVGHYDIVPEKARQYYGEE